MGWTNETYIVYSMEPSTLYSLRNRPIKLLIIFTLLTVWTHQHYVDYSMEPLSLRYVHHRYNTVRCFQYGLIKPTLFTVYPINITLFTVMGY